MTDVLVNELESQVYGTVTPFPPEHFPLQNPNCCEDSGLQCPLKANQTVIYHSTIGVPSGLPEVSACHKQYYYTLVQCSCQWYSVQLLCLKC